MSSKYSKQRLAAFKNQVGRCFYCGSPMWKGNPEKFASQHNITKKYATRFQCTAEHLVARCDGGKNQKSNIVAACNFCNQNATNEKSHLFRQCIKHIYRGGCNRGNGTHRGYNTLISRRTLKYYKMCNTK